jgi:hypothetical protein
VAAASWLAGWGAGWQPLSSLSSASARPHSPPCSAALRTLPFGAIPRPLPFQVRPKFLEAFAREPGGYPDAFPYRQRVLLLYQRIDGVDVCLFCMYVQEYGPDCPPPNR